MSQEVNEPVWKVQLFGDINSDQWELSIVHKDNLHGQKSWGWFNIRKLLISHNGGHCRWPLAPGLGSKLIQIAEGMCERMNHLESSGNREAQLRCPHCNSDRITQGYGHAGGGIGSYNICLACKGDVFNVVQDEDELCKNPT